MEKRIPYYVSRKNVFTWLAVITIAVSVIFRFIYYWGTGESKAQTWWLIILPLIACILLIIELLMYGKEHFYRTCIPVWMFCVYYALKIVYTNYSLRWVFLYFVGFFAIGYVYAHTVMGKEKKWLAFLIFLGFFGFSIYKDKSVIFDGNIRTLLPRLPDILFPLSGIFIVLAMRIHLDEKYHPYWGDRSDGRRVRSISPLTMVANYVMPTRNGAANQISDSVEVTALDRYIAEKRKNGYPGFGVTHVFMAAYVRCVAKYPGVNRFLSGQKIYTRGEDIQICMVVKESMSLDAEESVIKIHLTPRDTIDTVYKKLSEKIAEVKNNKVGGSDFDKTARLFSYIPGVVFKFTMWFLKLLDYLGLFPAFLLEVSPFHGSVFFTSLASLGIKPVVHHLYDFGNLPVFCAFGAKRTETEVGENGAPVRKKYIDYTFNTDERTVDGFYYAQVFKYFKRLLTHPEKLENPPEEVVSEVD